MFDKDEATHRVGAQIGLWPIARRPRALPGERMLAGRYFRVVFTLPSELRALAAFAPRAVYDALFRTAGRVLLEFGQRRLKAEIGATLMLHTWTRVLAFHLHVHAIVTAGGLALDGSSHKASSRAFLFPIKAMARVLRGKMIDALKEAYAQGSFAGFDDFVDPESLARMIRTIAKLHWIVNAEPSFARGMHVISYLGRYTHRVAISNSRLLDVTPTTVTFRTKGDAVESLRPVDVCPTCGATLRLLPLPTARAPAVEAA